MKRIFYIPLLLSLFVFLSCDQEADESLDPRPLLVNGQFMRLDITKDRFNANDLANTSFGGKLTSPSGIVVRYELLVRVTRAGELVSDYLPYDEITSFPYDLNVTPATIEAVYAEASIPLTLTNGDKIRFIAFSYDAAGNKVGFTNLSRTVQTQPGYKQAYRFNFAVLSDLTSDVNNYEGS